MHRVVRSYIPIAEKALTRNWQFKMDLVPWTVLSARLHPPLQVSVRSKFLLDTSDIYNAIYSNENLKKCLRDFQESALQIWSLLSTEISFPSFLHTTLFVGMTQFAWHLLYSSFSFPLVHISRRRIQQF